MRIVIIVFATVSLLCQSEAHAQKLIENEFVVAWRLPSGAPAQPLASDRMPGVVITLANGAVRLVDDVNAVASPGVVVVALKAHRLKPIQTPPGLAPAFPRDGVAGVADSDRVAVWHVRWTTGQKTPMHFHDKDVVVIYLNEGMTRSIPQGGAPTATKRSAGEVVYLPRGRTHIEECVEGPRQDIVIELK